LSSWHCLRASANSDTFFFQVYVRSLS
jgi:hypothetical protein